MDDRRARAAAADPVESELMSAGETVTTRRKALRLAAAGLVVGGAAYAGYRTLGRDSVAAPTLVVGQQAPALSGPGLDGAVHDLEDLRGRTVLVNVWASWCAPCRDEYPVLKQAARSLRGEGLEVLGINTQDTQEKARNFLAELGGEAYPSVLDPDGRIAVEWGTAGVPETFLIDRDGLVRLRLVGEVTSTWITSAVLPVLG